MAATRFRHLAVAVSLLTAALALAWAWPDALGDDAPVWNETEWRCHPPPGFGSSGYDRQAFAPLANGWVAVLGQLYSTYDGFIQLHDENGRWLWTTLLQGEDGIVGYWSQPAVVAVRSNSGAWDLVASENEGHYVWRIDAQGSLLWRRRLDRDIGLDLAPAMAAEDGAVWLGGWAETDDMCGEGAAVVKLDETGNAVWRWRQPEPSFAAVNDLLPLSGGRLLVLIDYGGPLAYLGSMAAVCPQSEESELVLLDADGKELARRMLPSDSDDGTMLLLADGRIALPREPAREGPNRLLIIAVHGAGASIEIQEAKLDPLLLNVGFFGLLPVGAHSDGSLILYNGRALHWVLPSGRVVRTQELPGGDLWHCELKTPPALVCLGYYTLKSLDLP